MTDHEQRLAKLQKQFHGLRIMGGEGVTVYGSPVRGYVVEVKAGVVQSGTSGAGEDVFGCTDPAATNFNPSATVDDGSCVYPTGACCVGSDCSVTTAADCATMGGTYQGDGTACDPNPCNTCPECTAHVHIEFSEDFEGPCNVSTSEDHDVAISWLNCDFTVSSEKFDLIIPLTSAIDDPLGCFGPDLASAYYEIFAFYDTDTGWTFTFKIHLGLSSFNTSPDDPGPGLVNLDELGTLCQTAYGGTSCAFFTCL